MNSYGDSTKPEATSITSYCIHVDINTRTEKYLFKYGSFKSLLKHKRYEKHSLIGKIIQHLYLKQVCQNLQMSMNDFIKMFDYDMKLDDMNFYHFQKNNTWETFFLYYYQCQVLTWMNLSSALMKQCLKKPKMN